jgi:FkbM family methyltransferase
MTTSNLAVTPVWKRAVAFSLRAITAVGLLFICFEIGVWLHPPLLAWGLGAIDRNLICSSSEAFRGAQKHAHVGNGWKDLVGKSRILQRDAGVNLWRTPFGDWWIPKGSEEPVMAFLVQQRNKIYGEGVWSIHKGDVVLDCGANVGAYTREALEEGASLVIAIEPAPVNVECLRRNFKREIEEKRVVVAALGVWDKDDVLPLFEDPANSGGDSFVIKGRTDLVSANIPLTSIDKLARDLHLARVDFIKMDIKGATMKALTGAKETLKYASPRLALSTEEKEDNANEIHSLVMRLQPSYRMACGLCSVAAGLRVNPDVLLFR